MTGDLVVCSLEPWDEVWRRNQLLVRELIAIDPDLRVLFVEPPRDLTHERSRRDGARTPRPQPVGDSSRLWAHRPLKLLPRVVGPWADHWLFRQLHRAIAQLHFEKPLLWVNDSVYAQVVKTSGWRSVYDITDDWLLASVARRELRRRRRRESLLLASADEVVVCSASLAASREATRQVHVIPNAVDAPFFRSPQRRPNDLSPAPVAVYPGTLHEDRLDVELVLELARARPTLAIVLVGPDALAGSSRRRLRSCRNVKILGTRPYRAMPGYLQHADVLFVPHRVTPFTESLDPIKAYEALAVGRPTVTTEVAGFRDIGPPIVAVPRERFVDEVGALVDALPLPSCPREVPTWRDRALAFDSVLRSARAAGKGDI